MARERLSADIVVGSIWPGVAGGFARVLHAQSNEHTRGYVTIERNTGEREELSVMIFRERYIAPFDAKAIRSQFTMSVKNLVTMRAFFSPTLRRFFARSARVDPRDCFKPSRGRPALPKDAVLVGTYEDPVRPEEFFEDLCYVLDLEGA